MKFIKEMKNWRYNIIITYLQNLLANRFLLYWKITPIACVCNERNKPSKTQFQKRGAVHIPYLNNIWYIGKNEFEN